MGIPALAPRLRGRATETGVLPAALDRVARSGQAIVLLEGEAGIGKGSAEPERRPATLSSVR